MKVVGLTGGIGSGKSTIAAMFSELGVPVYIADIEARALTNRSKIIRRHIIQLLGSKAYNDSEINRKFVAAKVFNDPELLQALNAIIHPKVQRHFERWLRKQSGAYCIKEAAILFENGGYKKCDHTILVKAPEPERIQRVMERDGTTKKEIQDRIDNQWTDEEKEKLADFIIDNIDLKDSQKRVLELHKIFSEAT